MKFNLNHYMISSKQYMEYLSYKFNLESYDQFSDICQAEKVLHPYLYTMHILPKKTVEGFRIFYKTYLDKCEISYEWHDNIEDTIGDDITLKVTFILAAQYYFL